MIQHDYIIVYRIEGVLPCEMVRVSTDEVGTFLLGLSNKNPTIKFLSVRAVCEYSGTNYPEAQLCHEPCPCLSFWAAMNHADHVWLERRKEE